MNLADPDQHPDPFYEAKFVNSLRQNGYIFVLKMRNLIQNLKILYLKIFACGALLSTHNFNVDIGA